MDLEQLHLINVNIRETKLDNMGQMQSGETYMNVWQMITHIIYCWNFLHKIYRDYYLQFWITLPPLNYKAPVLHQNSPVMTQLCLLC